MGAAKVLEPQLANSLALLVVAAGSQLRSVNAMLGVRVSKEPSETPWPLGSSFVSSPEGLGVLCVIGVGVWEYTHGC